MSFYHNYILLVRQLLILSFVNKEMDKWTHKPEILMYMAQAIDDFDLCNNKFDGEVKLCSYYCE